MLPSLQNFRAASLETIEDYLRLYQEGPDRVNSRHAADRWRSIKPYAKFESVIHIKVRLRAGPSDEFNLIVHRVPARHHKAHRAVFLDNFVYAGRNRADFGSDGHANCVFPIGKLGHASNDIITRSMPIRSAIWLVRNDDVPKIPRDFRSAGVLTFEFPFPQIDQIRRPGVMGILDRNIDYAASGKERLIESIPSVVDSFRDLPCKDRGDGSYKLHLKDLLASCWISFNKAGNPVVVAEESFYRLFSLQECRVAPFDQLARRVETAQIQSPT